MDFKKVAILSIILFCCLTVVPMCVLLVNAMFVDRWDESVLGNMFEELK